MNDNSVSSLEALLKEPLDRVRLARRAAEWIAELGNYRWVGLYEVTPPEIGMIACTGETPPAFPRFALDRGLCGAAVAAKTIVNVSDVRNDPRWLTTFGSTRSEIVVPILELAADRPIGLIDVESDAWNAFSPDDEHFLSACARRLSLLFR
jgi:GAF domain-containing protein